MIPGICPTTNKQCELYTEWCTHEGQGTLAMTTTEIGSVVEVMARRVPCHDIQADDNGPVEAVCAAEMAIGMVAIVWLDKQG